MSAQQKKETFVLSNVLIRTKLTATGDFLTFEHTGRGSALLPCFIQPESLYLSLWMTTGFDGEGGLASLWGHHRISGLFTPWRVADS